MCLCAVLSISASIAQLVLRAFDRRVRRGHSKAAFCAVVVRNDGAGTTPTGKNQLSSNTPHSTCPPHSNTRNSPRLDTRTASTPTTRVQNGRAALCGCPRPSLTPDTHLGRFLIRCLRIYAREIPKVNGSMEGAGAYVMKDVRTSA
ncbi:hypothetical protein BC827DRAFT_416800 [Russula dissimulans]|jgi:hypothetical protein|nr:hypothetical protein BC827DRAFT_416800 [Russula dissimulans]